MAARRRNPRGGAADASLTAAGHGISVPGCDARLGGAGRGGLHLATVPELTRAAPIGAYPSQRREFAWPYSVPSVAGSSSRCCRMSASCWPSRAGSALARSRSRFWRAGDGLSLSASGWLEEALDAERPTRFERDDAGRIVRKRFAHGATHEFTVDEGGRALTARSSDRDLRFGYDALGRMVREEQDGLVSTHDFDARGRRVSTTLPDGRTIRIGHGEDGLYDSIHSGSTMLVRLHRDEAGREIEREAGRLRLHQEFDPEGPANLASGQQCRRRGSVPTHLPL